MHEPIVIHAHDHYVIGTCFASKHPILVTSGMDKQIKLWSVPDWELIRTFEGHQNSVNSLSLNPEENLLASGSTDASIRVWSFPSGELLHTLTDRKQTVAQVKFSDSGRLLGGAYYGGYVAIWDKSGEPIFKAKASKKNLASIDFHPNENLVALSGLGDEILLWSIAEAKLVHKFFAHTVAVSGLRFTQSGKVLVSMGYDQTVKFWNTETWEVNQLMSFDQKPLRSLSFSHDEKVMAIALEGVIQLWSLSSWNLLEEFPAGAKALNQLSFSQDNQWLAAGAADQKVRVWSLNLSDML